VAHTFLSSAISKRNSCLSRFLIPRITLASFALYRDLKGPEHAVWTRFACKNNPCIHILVAPKLFPLFLWLFVSCPLARGLVCRQRPHRFETNSCSSQTGCIRLVIAHGYPAGDTHQTARGLPELRALVPTCNIQVLSSTSIITLSA